jgi:hypothetical protein
LFIRQQTSVINAIAVAGTLATPMLWDVAQLAPAGLVQQTADVA